MRLDDLPDVLTVEEAARVLWVGRTLGYQLARQFIDTVGREGLPMVTVGRNPRVPKVLLAKVLAGELTLGPTANERTNSAPGPPSRARRSIRTTPLSLLDHTRQS